MDRSKIISAIIFTQDIEARLAETIAGYRSADLFLATETTVTQYCLPLIQNLVAEKGIRKVVIPAGEQHKTLRSAQKIWEFLSKNEAGRKSLMINLGGGMLTDLGGFAASTFKRGIDFINIPTTLLAQVDASVGGKTGINFNGLKNEVGTFREPKAVFIDVHFLKTLDKQNMVSGYAEMIKHGLIKSPEHLEELKTVDLQNIDYQKLEKAINHSVEIKKYFVESDPEEQNLRKGLNFGHTAGHAFESLSLQQKRPVLHGYAVAYGLVTELFLSRKKMGLPERDFQSVTQWIKKIYGKFAFDEKDFETLYARMVHDKKNAEGQIYFTLIPEIGKVVINQVCSKEEILEALTYSLNS
jgi:3-dehydroquinate synthase